MRVKMLRVGAYCNTYVYIVSTYKCKKVCFGLLPLFSISLNYKKNFKILVITVHEIQSGNKQTGIGVLVGNRILFLKTFGNVILKSIKERVIII